ncbi:RNA polymerase sigma factor [Bordetella genomosp. 13]|uniref:RNA polymerase sigma factor n=1 Tax=Bordetella genomosp. 13 TaxID=463040 RepID=UPI00119E20B8|nr:RNA polymerase sigma factor [Bordetella genomosp. 13]
MSEGLTRLQQLLGQCYDTLRLRVARRLGGSTDMASDALHDAYVRLASMRDLDQVRYPRTYLVNTAVNAAIDRIRSDSRLLGDDEIESVFEQARQAQPGVDTELAARQRLSQVVGVLQGLPSRQSALLVAHRVNGEAIDALARRWGISTRMVRLEIQKAASACMTALDSEDGNG